MAPVSAPHTQSALPNSHVRRVDTVNWNFPLPKQIELLRKASKLLPNDSQSHNTNSDALTHQIISSNVSSHHSDTQASMRTTDNALSPSVQTYVSNRQNSSISDTGSAADSLIELYGPNLSMNSVDSQYQFTLNGMISKDDDGSESSRWIHRDKLAQIESQELQAAGIVLPRSYTLSKTSSQRNHSKDVQQINNFKTDTSFKRQLIDSLPTEEEEAPENSSWDLRLPEEVAAVDGFTDISSSVKSISRIPVCKKSPLPIPMAHLERDTILPRKKSGQWAGDDEGLPTTKIRDECDNAKNSVPSAYPPYKRSVSENLITKKSGLQLTSTSVNRESSHRPSVRSGSNANSTILRTNDSGHAASKHPEGDPPWLSSMYKPDPRLPPDQQLLPTIAKRLQQEQWEKEGKFGNTYDTSFRPLNDKSPAGRSQPPPIQVNIPEAQKNDEWPLQSPKNLTLPAVRPGTAGGYSTMPKIIETPPKDLPSTSLKPSVKAPKPIKVEEKKKCGCCAVM